MIISQGNKMTLVWKQSGKIHDETHTMGEWYSPKMDYISKLFKVIDSGRQVRVADLQKGVENIENIS